MSHMSIKAVGSIQINLHSVDTTTFVAAFDSIEETLGANHPIVRKVWLYLNDCNLETSRFTLSFNATDRHGAMTLSNGLTRLDLGF